jgi:hypothetical protein
MASWRDIVSALHPLRPVGELSIDSNGIHWRGTGARRARRGAALRGSRLVEACVRQWLMSGRDSQASGARAACAWMPR